MTPQQIFDELSKYVIGQEKAKKAIARSLRDRYRRMQILDEELRDEIIPKNIIFIGPTGVGKTEIVQRTSKICDLPFIKVEATRFTEVGYVGRDVESIIKDFVEKTIIKYKERYKSENYNKAKSYAENEIVSILMQMDNAPSGAKHDYIAKLRNGEFDARDVKIEVREDASSQIVNFADFEGSGLNSGALQVGMISISDLFRGDEKKKLSKMPVKEALLKLINEKLFMYLKDKDFAKIAIQDIENNGIVFIDEIDKLVSAKDSGGRGDISREGVQRDLLPIIEGTSVQTRHGYVNTKHILFIACGAFYSAKPSDLLPELQGRLPVRVKLSHLSREDFIEILSKKNNNLITQYKEMLKVDGVEIIVSKDGINEIASIAYNLNVEIENLGARRLYDVVEAIMSDIAYENPSSVKKTDVIKVKIDAKFVANQASEIKLKINNKNRFIL